MSSQYDIKRRRQQIIDVGRGGQENTANIINEVNHLTLVVFEDHTVRDHHVALVCTLRVNSSLYQLAHKCNAI